MSVPVTSPPQLREFRLDGSVSLFVPVAPLVKGADVAHTPTRRMAGWLTTYGKLAADGSVIPTRDRDEQVMDAARDLADIDWSSYVRGGLWNDHHRARLPDGSWPASAPGAKNVEVFVGVPTSLDYHDGTTPLSKAHGKVGFFTSGHLFDRFDPSSWQLYTDHVPTAEDLDRADALWEIAQILDGTSASLGLSAHGLAQLSDCRRRIIAAKITQAAVVTGPRNPDSTLDLVKGVHDDLITALGRAKPMASVAPCGRCTCTVRCDALVKGGGAPPPQMPASATSNQPINNSPSDYSTIDSSALDSGLDSAALSDLVPEDLEGSATARIAEMRKVIILRIQEKAGCDEATAKRWLSEHPYESETSA